MTAVTHRLAPSFLPATAVLEMTYACNHRCIFCSCPWFNADNSFETAPEMKGKQWQQWIGMLCGMGVCNLAFTGGEPLLKKGLVKIIQYAANRTSEHIETVDGQLISRFAPPKLFLLSNGLAMNDAILAICRDYQIHLSLSLPGLATFKEHTGVDNARGILTWFEKAHAKGVSTTVGITVTRKNLGELYETIAAAFLAGADNLLLNRFLPGGRGLAYETALSLNGAEIKTMLDTAEEVLTTANRYGSVGTELPKCLVDVEKYKHLQVGTRCSAALDFLWWTRLGSSGCVIIPLFACTISKGLQRSNFIPIGNNSLKKIIYQLPVRAVAWCPSVMAGAAKRPISWDMP